LDLFTSFLVLHRQSNFPKGKIDNLLQHDFESIRQRTLKKRNLYPKIDVPGGDFPPETGTTTVQPGLALWIATFGSHIFVFRPRNLMVVVFVFQDNSR
jgi:hypothetical protein